MGIISKSVALLNMHTTVLMNDASPVIVTCAVRARAADAIQALGSRHRDLKVVSGLKKTETVAQFYEFLRDVKFFVSPYGYGEFANKDYEAILSGCVLVMLHHILHHLLPAMLSVRK